MAVEKSNDTVRYLDGDGIQATAEMVVAVNPDGSPLPGSKRIPIGYDQITNAQLVAAQALPNVPDNAIEADIQNNGSQNARFRDDGVNPTPSTGQRIYAADTLTYRGDLTAIRLIKEDDGVTLDILYYGVPD